MLIPILFIILVLVCFSSYFISNRVYKALRKENNDYAWVWSILTFILSFALLAFLILYLIVDNIRFER